MWFVLYFIDLNISDNVKTWLQPLLGNSSAPWLSYGPLSLGGVVHVEYVLELRGGFALLIPSPNSSTAFLTTLFYEVFLGDPFSSSNKPITRWCSSAMGIRSTITCLDSPANVLCTALKVLEMATTSASSEWWRLSSSDAGMWSMMKKVKDWSRPRHVDDFRLRLSLRLGYCLPNCN